MSATSSLFSQILSIFSRPDFLSFAARHKSDYAAKGFSSWEHFVSMLFCQLAQARSLREIQDGLRACEGKLNHLGLATSPKRSTLSYANAHRPWQLFESLFYHLLERCPKQCPGKKFRFKNKLLSLDSTTIDLCASMFDWANFRQTKGAVKLHLLLDHEGYLPTFAHVSNGKMADVTLAQQLELAAGSIVVMDRGYNDYRLFARWTAKGVYFVTRQKQNADVMVVKRMEVPPGTNILADEVVRLNAFNAGRPDYPDLRRVTLWLEDKQEELVLWTNQFKLAASTIGAIYKDRWQIELFFKALKQQLKIKTFVGTSSNAVHIQIWTALIAMLLLKHLQMSSKIKWALSNLVALLRWNLFTHRNLWQWINHPFDFDLPDEPLQMDLALDSSG